MQKLLLPLLLFALPLLSAAQPLISFQQIITGLSQPVDLVEVDDSTNRIFIVERTGKIRIWKNDHLLTTPFLDVSNIITSAGSEQGLLSLAFHPDYKTNGYFYIYYTDPSRAINVARYNRSNDSIADPVSGTVLLTIPKSYSNHNGGHLLFGSDRLLYFGTGDGGSRGDPENNAQDGQSLLGKMLRIDVNNPNPPYYSIPPSNPYIGSTTTREEIIATGLRNPWRWSFDRETGDMWIADVGQDEWEEVNVVSPANILNKDYGWPCFEGTHVFKGCAAKPNNVSPIFDYPHNNTNGGLSITGGYVYRGNEYPGLKGYYICSDFSSGNGWLIKPNGSGGWTTDMQTSWPSISAYAELGNGALYAMTLDGIVYKVNASTPLQLQLVSFKGRVIGNSFELNWQVQNEINGAVYVLEKRENEGTSWIEVNRVTADDSRSQNSYSMRVAAAKELAFYRLKVISASGEVNFSSIVAYHYAASLPFKAMVSGTSLTVTTPARTSLIEVFDATGRAILKKKVNAGETVVNLPLTNSSKGVITVRATVDKERRSIQVVY